MSDQNTTAGFSTRLIVAVALTSLVLGIALAFFIIRGFMRPIRSLTQVADAVSQENLNVNAVPYNAKDEIRALMDAFYRLAAVLEEMLRDVVATATLQAGGDYDARMDVSRYEGRFADLISAINNMQELSVGKTHAIIETIQKYADGDFSAILPPFPGKSAGMNEIMDAVSHNLQAVSEEVLHLAQAAHKGEFDPSADTARFCGDWAVIIAGMNDMLSAVEKPLDETAEALSHISWGRLEVRVEGNYQGKFAAMKDTLK